ncbi:MAG: transposase [Gammaproteobacteria bacterium]|nr:transposase [Gammaproteobacteria bacterium]
MDYRRHRLPGGSCFFTVVTQHRRPLLVDHIEALRAAFRLVRSRYPFAIEAIVVLPDHLHTLWRLPDGDSDYSRRWMVLKRAFSSALPAAPASPSQARKREKGVWQRRFWEHTIRDEADWARHMDYIHYNPVKHGYVDSPAAWPWSSFPRWVARGVYEPGWGAGEPPGLPVVAGE